MQELVIQNNKSAAQEWAEEAATDVSAPRFSWFTSTFWW